MKKLFLSPLVLTLLFFLPFIRVMSASVESDKNVTVVCPDNYRNLCTEWIKACQKKNPDLKITILSDTDYKSGKNISGELIFIGNDDSEPAAEWKTSAGRNILAAVINKANPAYAQLQITGVKPENIFGNSNLSTWGKILQDSNPNKVNFYITNDDAKEGRISNIINNKTANFVLEDDIATLKEALNKDVNGIGIALYKDLTNNGELTSGIAFLPFDKNSNGKLDPFEKIYSSSETFLRGVWTGKYLPELTENIFIYAKTPPQNAAELAFIKWILSDGQEILSAQGYSELGANERASKIELLTQKENLSASEIKSAGIFWVLAAALILIAGIIFSFAFRKRPAAQTFSGHAEIKVLKQSSVRVPKGLFFDKSHTWTFMEKDGLVRLGLDDFMCRLTGPVSRISMKQPGEKIMKGEKIFTLVQNGKQLNILSPVSGIIRTKNSRLENEGGLISYSPFEDGWVYMIEPDNWLRESSLMFMAEKYSEWLKNEFSRVKDFFSVSPALHNEHYAAMVLQDGGELRENVLKELGPDVWEDFQSIFIDSSI